MSIERLMEEIKRLSRTEKEELMRALRLEEERDLIREKFEAAAGSWADFNAEEFLNEIYAKRDGGKPGAEW